MVLNSFLTNFEDLSLMILISYILITKSVYTFNGLLQCKNNDFIGLYQRKINFKKPYHFELR